MKLVSYGGFSQQYCLLKWWPKKGKEHKYPWVLIRQCLLGVNNMSKEHKNKRDTKKSAAKSPKEKKAEKLERKKQKGVFNE